jgi:hypothetical protein
VAYCNANFLDESDAGKLDTSAKTDVYSFRRVHRHASCSAGALMCNIQTSTVVKTSWTLLNISNFPEHCQCTFRSFCCQHRSIPYLPGVSTAVSRSGTQQCYSGKCGYRNINNGHKNETKKPSVKFWLLIQTPNHVVKLVILKMN